MEREKQVVDALLSKAVVGSNASVFMYIWYSVCFSPHEAFVNTCFGLMLVVQYGLCLCVSREDWKIEKNSKFWCSPVVSSG